MIDSNTSSQTNEEQNAYTFQTRKQIEFSKLRVVLKISGELFSHEKDKTFTETGLKAIATGVKELVDAGSEVILVVGAGNIIRGKDLYKTIQFNRTTSDLIGMYATVVNAITLKEALRKYIQIESFVMAPSQLVGPRGGSEESSLLSYDIQLAQSLVKKKKPIICAGGIGNPFFTTDTAAILRAIELDADLVIKSTKVNGIYSKDPCLFNDAIKYPYITFEEVIEQKLSVMDQTAFLLAKEHRLPIFIFKHTPLTSIRAALEDEMAGSFILPKKDGMYM